MSTLRCFLLLSSILRIESYSGNLKGSERCHIAAFCVGCTSAVGVTVVNVGLFLALLRALRK